MRNPQSPPYQDGVALKALGYTSKSIKITSTLQGCEQEFSPALCKMPDSLQSSFAPTLPAWQAFTAEHAPPRAALSARLISQEKLPSCAFVRPPPNSFISQQCNTADLHKSDVSDAPKGKHCVTHYTPDPVLTPSPAK